MLKARLNPMSLKNIKMAGLQGQRAQKKELSNSVKDLTLTLNPLLQISIKLLKRRLHPPVHTNPIGKETITHQEG
jgi:hypothetical protein